MKQQPKKPTKKQLIDHIADMDLDILDQVYLHRNFFDPHVQDYLDAVISDRSVLTGF